MKRRIVTLLICSMIVGLCHTGVMPSKASASTHGLSNPTIINGITTWDTIYFGNYWQEDTNGDGVADKNDVKTPIKWRVLSIDGDDAFLLADKNLDVQKYNNEQTSVTWENSDMRKWLNNSFINNAFSFTEQTGILMTTITNAEKSQYQLEGGILPEGGNDTQDKVFLLSLDDVLNVQYGFSSSMERTDIRQAVNTEYVANGGEIKTTSMYNEGQMDHWWLRSPGYYYNASASFVFREGEVRNNGRYVDGDNLAVRPALHLDLSVATGWSYAGDVRNHNLHKPIVSSVGVTTWDTIYFGNYWQEDTNGDGAADKNDAKTPIKWRVLSVDGDDAFLLADRNLDCQQYNTTQVNVTWETCTLRSWLNDVFYNDAFISSEQEKIVTTTVVNEDNGGYGTEGGNDTQDKIYLLSSKEALNVAYGFSAEKDDSGTREASVTEYTLAGGGIQSSNLPTRDGISYWWLRTPGQLGSQASLVNLYGSVYTIGHDVSDDSKAIRPVLHIDLSSADWTDAGTVASDGTITEPATTEAPSVTPQSTIVPEPTVAPTTTPSYYEYFPVRRESINGDWEEPSPGPDLVEAGTAVYESVPDDYTYYEKSYEFSHWEAQGIELDNPYLTSISFLMPANAVSLTAYYKLVGEESPDTTEAPVIITPKPTKVPISTIGPGPVQTEKPVTSMVPVLTEVPHVSPTPTEVPNAGTTSPMYSVYIGKAQTNPTEAMNVTLWGNFVGGSYVSQEAHEIYTENGVEYVFSHWYAKGVRLENPYNRAISFHMPANEVTLTPIYRKKEETTSQPTPDKTDPLKENEAKVVTPGTAITQGSLVYKVLKNSGKDKTVMVVKAKNKKVKTITIPKAIKINGESFKVVEIAKNACKGCKKLKKVTIGAEVKVIGSNAFAKCKKLKTIVIKSKKLKKVGKKAFAGIGKNASIRVPKSKVKAYRKLLK